MTPENTASPAADPADTRLTRWAGTFLVIAIMGCSVLVAAGAGTPVLLAGGGLTAVFITLRARSIPVAVWRTGGSMLVVAGVVLALSPDPAGDAARGLRTTVAFLSIVAAVSLLGARSAASPAVRRIGRTLGAAARQGRYAPVVTLSHLMAGGLSMAGITVLASAAAGDLRDDGSEAQNRLAMAAILRGFCGAITWTPMMGNMALMLALYGLDWPQILPINLSVAVAMIVIGIGFEATRRARLPRGPMPPGIGRLFLGVIGTLGVIVPLLLTIAKLIGLPVAGVIVIGAALAAMLWAWIERHPRSRPIPAMIAHDAAERFPTLASEALLFLGAGLASAAVAGIIPPEVAAFAGKYLFGSAGLFFLFCVVFVGGSALIGLHPALLALLIAQALPPDAIGVPALGHFAALMAGWSIVTTSGPFTVIGLMLGRIAERPSTTVTTSWNLGYVLVTAPFTALVIEGLTRLWA